MKKLAELLPTADNVANKKATKKEIKYQKKQIMLENRRKKSKPEEIVENDIEATKISKKLDRSTGRVTRAAVEKKDKRVPKVIQSIAENAQRELRREHPYNKRKKHVTILMRHSVEVRRKATERKRLERERLKLDLTKYAEAKAKERERSKKRRENGKIKSIDQLSTKDKKKQRQEWNARNRKRLQRKKKAKAMNTFVNVAERDVQQIASLRSRKIREKRHRDEKNKLKVENERLKKLVGKWQQRHYRLQKQNQKSPSPGKKAVKIMQQGKNAIRRKLIFGEIISNELKSTEVHDEVSPQELLTNRRILAKRFSRHEKHIKKYKLKGEFRTLVGRRSNEKVKMLGSKTPNSFEMKRRQLYCKLRKEVQTFFEEDGTSFFAPGKRDTITKNKNKCQKRYLSAPMQELHKKFNLTKNRKISYSFFCRCKPFWVIQRPLNARDTCMCMTHENFKFLFEKCKQLNLLKGHKSTTQLLQSLCCDINRKECMYRQCDLCKDNRVCYDYSAARNISGVFYHKWVRGEEERTKKGKTFSVKVMNKIKNYCSIKELTTALNDSLNAYMQHRFRAHHQTSFSQSLKNELNQDEVFFVFDFSQNYNLKYSNEVQSRHFGASNCQLTLHTGAYHIKNLEDGEVSVSTFCSVSESPRHDAPAIWAHLMPVFNKMKNENPQVKKVHVMSDGPTTQYRNKTNMFLFAHFMKELGFELATYNFSEAGHGKSTADGVGGNMKSTADNCVKYGSDIASINEFVEAFEKKNGKIKLFVINDSEINEIDTKVSALNLSRIPGTLKLHQVAIHAPNLKLLNLRYLSCLDCRNSFECRHYNHGPDFDISVPEAKINASVPKESNAAYSVEEHDVPESEIQFGKWVAVIYDDQWFPGVIEKIDPSKKTISASFMSRSNAYFRWPLKKDVQCVKFEGILCLLQPPKKETSRLYSFEEYQKVNQMCAKFV